MFAHRSTLPSSAKLCESLCLGVPHSLEIADLSIPSLAAQFGTLEHWREELRDVYQAHSLIAMIVRPTDLDVMSASKSHRSLLWCIHASEKHFEFNNSAATFADEAMKRILVEEERSCIVCLAERAAASADFVGIDFVLNGMEGEYVGYRDSIANRIEGAYRLGFF